MIATSAALLAILASVAAGQHLKVLQNPVPHAEAAAACAAEGLILAPINAANIDAAENAVPAHASAWIASWNGDSYGGACLQFKDGAITAAPNCNVPLLPLCWGASSSSSRSSCSASSAASEAASEKASAKSSKSSSSKSSSSKSSSSKSSVSVPVSCSSSSSSSSSSRDLCPLVSVSSCSSSSSSSSEIDWCASSSSSCGCDDSSSSSWGCSFESSICGSSSSSSECDPCCAGVRKLTYQAPFGPGIYLAKVTQKFTVFDVFGPNQCANFGALGLALGFNVYWANTTPATPPATPAAILVGSNGQALCQLSAAGTPVTNGLSTVPYGAYYVVSRAWALNQPIYAMEAGVVYAANSIYNCYGEYVAVLLSNTMANLSFINNNCGEICAERCHDRPSSCAAICHNQMCRPSYLPRFKVGSH